MVAIEQAIKGMNTQVGHAYIVGIWVDDGDGDSASPVLDDDTLFSGKLPSSSFNFIPTHALIIIAPEVKLRMGVVCDAM